jgi:hypothetical protein
MIALARSTTPPDRSLSNALSDLGRVKLVQDVSMSIKNICTVLEYVRDVSTLEPCIQSVFTSQ